MSLLSSLRRVLTNSNGRKRRSRALKVEFLEDRTLLSVYTVNRLTDAGVGDGLAGDLRYCISRAVSGNDTVIISVSGAINLTAPLPELMKSVNIEGPGASSLTVRRDTGGNYRIFVVDSGATILISGLTISNGLSPGGNDANNFGGGIRNSGTLTVSDCKFTGNPGNAIFNLEGILTVRNSTFSGNTANGGGGVLENFGGTLDVSHSVFLGNNAFGSGCISNDSVGPLQGTMSVNACTISDNMGSGIANSARGTARISYCTISRNRQQSAAGGGITNQIQATLIVSNSTIDDNSGLNGGGIANFDSSLTVSDCTITRNVAQLPSFSAGGLANSSGSNATTAVLLNSTISDNSGNQVLCNQGVPGVSARVELRDTIVSSDGNSPNFVSFAALSSNGSQIISMGHNLSSDNGNGFLTGPGDLLNTKPLLGPLQNNGGLTPTMALLPGSPAIDAGDNTDAPQFDQRGPGFPRIVGKAIDIGAFEVQNGNTPSGSTNTQDFVAQVYRDLLHREADAGGLVFFTNQLDQGILNRFQFVLAIESSIEYRTNVVLELYSELLHRPPDQSGFSAWINFLGQGGTRNQLEVSIISSQEYFIRRGGGTASGFLQAVYQDVLGRPPDFAGLAFWNQILANGESDEDEPPSSAKRRQVTASILMSPEATQDQVQIWYSQFLGRAADPVGTIALSRALQQGLADEQAIAVLVGSQEYLSRV
jgi:hypothetical protein